MTNNEVAILSAKICHGRTCHECPIEGFCLLRQFADNETVKQKIVDAYNRLFNPVSFAESVPFTEDEVLSLFD